MERERVDRSGSVANTSSDLKIDTSISVLKDASIHSTFRLPKAQPSLHSLISSSFRITQNLLT